MLLPSTPAHSPLQGVTERQRGGSGSVAAKVVIKGETEGGGGEITVDQKRLAFNREEIEEVRSGRRGDVTTCLSTPRTVVEERSGAKKTD